VREEREAAFSTQPIEKEQLAAAREVELALIRSADTTLVVTPQEKERLREIVPEADVRILTNIHEVAPTAAAFSERSGMLFIGFFRHRPNADAVIWFVREVLPFLARMGSSPEFHVIGSAPPPELEELASEQVRIHGFVPDVQPFFESCRLSVAPLRYGAGVKGKINQSMALGVPCVMTSIGAEGTHVEHGVDGMIADDPQSFAEAVAEVYENEDLWQKVREGGVSNIDRFFSSRVARETLRELLEV
jgi:glycosyltransferase involved in cell wall biosynthesis